MPARTSRSLSDVPLRSLTSFSFATASIASGEHHEKNVRLKCARPRVCLISARSVEEPGNRAFDLFVLALAIVLEHDLAILVDDILRRPIAVTVSVPGPRVVVLRHRIGDAVPLQRGLNVGGGALDRKFRGVDADDDETAVLILGVKPGDVRQRVHAVDAAIGPEI